MNCRRLPPSDWTIASAKPPTDASQAEVEALLNRFHPLRADKYLEGQAPTTQPTARYIVTINESAACSQTDRQTRASAGV